MSKAIKIGRYVLGRTIGVGSFGKVKIATHEFTNHQVAVKILNKEKITSLKMDNKVKREIAIMKLFWHPHIVRLYEVIDSDKEMFMVLEYVSGEMFNFIANNGKLAENEARRIFQQIISGVDYCHQHGVIHRDLKPENLLIDSNNNIKIADFGLSNMVSDGDLLQTSCGSPNYAAPEVIKGELYAGPEIDVWSCGVILYALLCGSLPFDHDQIPELFKKIKGGIYSLPLHLSDGSRDLISKMLIVDSARRITIPEIRQHEWFKTSLPPYITHFLDRSSRSISVINTDILAQLCEKLNFTQEQAIEALKSGDWNEAAVAYHLIQDHQIRLQQQTPTQTTTDQSFTTPVISSSLINSSPTLTGNESGLAGPPPPLPTSPTATATATATKSNPPDSSTSPSHLSTSTSTSTSTPITVPQRAQLLTMAMPPMQATPVIGGSITISNSSHPNHPYTPSPVINTGRKSMRSKPISSSTPTPAPISTPASKSVTISTCVSPANNGSSRLASINTSTPAPIIITPGLPGSSVIPGAASLSSSNHSSRTSSAANSVSNTPTPTSKSRKPATITTTTETKDNLDELTSLLRGSRDQVWVLGFETHAPPSFIMPIVFSSLKQAGFEWKVVQPYVLQARYTRSSTKDQSMSIGLRLYKLAHNHYLLDIQKLKGGLFSFFDAVSAIQSNFEANGGKK